MGHKRLINTTYKIDFSEPLYNSKGPLTSMGKHKEGWYLVKTRGGALNLIDDYGRGQDGKQTAWQKHWKKPTSNGYVSRGIISKLAVGQIVYVIKNNLVHIGRFVKKKRSSAVFADSTGRMRGAMSWEIFTSFEDVSEHIESLKSSLLSTRREVLAMKVTELAGHAHGARQ